MSVFHVLPAIAPSARTGLRCSGGDCSALRGSFRWLIRPRRMLLALAAVWVVNVFDLGYTLIESFHSNFIEMNPVAARLIQISPKALISYKAALPAVSSVILLIYRRHRAAEIGCWFLLAVHVYVAACWWLYYEQRLTALEDPAVNFDPFIGCYQP